ncbi:MAG TPA: M42 family peptidase, partial [Candidatus Intestinimonas stercorigallinarum]|nr:M42 family peptidase [Candidatus Intestinimonas stercorigallinarum]
MAGPSGFEGPVAMQAAELMRPFMDEAHVDRFGNAVGVRLCGRLGAPRLLLDAHLDEIGLIVTGIEEGFLRFRTIGGVDPRMLPDRELTVLTDPPILGVVACLPPHVLKAGDMKKSIPIDQLRVDIGMSQDEAERRVPIGTP